MFRGIIWQSASRAVSNQSPQDLRVMVLANFDTCIFKIMDCLPRKSGKYQDFQNLKVTVIHGSWFWGFDTPLSASGTASNCQTGRNIGRIGGGRANPPSDDGIVLQRSSNIESMVSTFHAATSHAFTVWFIPEEKTIAWMCEMLTLTTRCSKIIVTQFRHPDEKSANLRRHWQHWEIFFVPLLFSSFLIWECVHRDEYSGVLKCWIIQAIEPIVISG